MSCLYSVRFLPDAKCDYDDELVVESLSTPLVVPIHARQPPPRLTRESSRFSSSNASRGVSDDDSEFISHICSWVAE